jgi:3-hydroxyacyl-CoA dehydrogenase
LADFGERMLGKGIVWAKDTPNFVGNRIGVQGMVKAMQLMVEEGLTIPEVDALFGPVMGRPKTAMFKTADLVGLDTMGHVARNTYELVTERRGPRQFRDAGVRRQDDRKGAAGQKVQGRLLQDRPDARVEESPQGHRPGNPRIRRLMRNPVSLPGRRQKGQDAAGENEGRGLRRRQGRCVRLEGVAHQLIYSANRIPEISDTIVEIDNAMKWGYNFEMGPFETWDAIGVAESVAKMAAEGMAVPAKVTADAGRRHDVLLQNRKRQSLYYDFATATTRRWPVSAKHISLAALKGAGKW